MVDIKQSIPHTKGIEEFINKTLKKQTKCATCMIGKNTVQVDTQKDGAGQPQTHRHLFISSSAQSIEFYKHTAVFVDCDS